MSYFRDTVMFTSNEDARLSAFVCLIETEGAAPMPEWVHEFLGRHWGGSRFASHYEGNTPMVTTRDLAEVMGLPVEQVVPALRATLSAARNPDSQEATVERLARL